MDNQESKNYSVTVLDVDFFEDKCDYDKTNSETITLVKVNLGGEDLWVRYVTPFFPKENERVVVKESYFQGVLFGRVAWRDTDMDYEFQRWD
jgi:hypothetical protein